MTRNAEKVRRYWRRVTALVDSVLVVFGFANIVSPIGNRASGWIMLLIGAAGLVALRVWP